MSLLARTGRIFVHSEPTDMRKSEGTLAAIVRLQMGRRLLDGDLFVFIGRDARRAKILFWDGTGTCLFSKRIEKGRFAAPWRAAASAAKRLLWTATELALFLEGSELLLRGAVSPPPWEPGEGPLRGPRENNSGTLNSLARRPTNQPTRPKSITKSTSRFCAD